MSKGDQQAFEMFVCTLGFVAGIAAGMGIQRLRAAHTEDRCNIACQGEADSWSDRTHICVCSNGRTLYIHSEVDEFRPARREAP